jgi:peptidoglycan endopeptidase LytE
MLALNETDRSCTILLVSAGAPTYSVKAGDTLTKIAKQFGVTIKAIKTRNGLKSDLIVVGQALVILAWPPPAS